MIIKNTTVITCDNQKRILPNSTVIIGGDGRIHEILVNNTDDVNPAIDEDVIYAHDQYLMPSSICAHTHFYGAFSRGMYIPGEAPDAFPAILEKLWWKLDKSLNEEANYYSALVCIIDAIKHGTSTLIDHHASPNSINGSLDVLAKAVRQSGIRASLCYEVTDRDGMEKARQGLDENLRFINEIKNISGNQLSAMFGLHASLTLSDETLKKSRNLCPTDVGFHIHAAEHNVDEYDSLKKSGKRVIERLDDFGILGPKTLIAHGVHIDAKEIGLLAKTGSWLSHQPRSNMNNAVGLPPIESMLNAGVKVCLGNDGFSNSMWQEWNAAYLAHKLINYDPRRMPADLIYQMAIINNRELINTQFAGLDTGVIKPGAAADLMLVDYQPFTEINSDNLPWHIVFGFRESMISSMIVNGKVLMRDRELRTLDEKSIIKEASRVSESVWKKYHSLF
jgi:putative selenium metabolism protein SsnA